MGTIMIIVGAVLLGAGIIINLTSRGEKKVTEDISTDVNSSALNSKPRELQSQFPEEAQSVSDSVIENNSVTSEGIKEPDFKKMGNDFEGYVADIFKANDIRLKQWNQGSTSPEGAYAENELNPDFFVSHKDGKKPLEYWVECKYRSTLPKAGFSLEDYQLNRYYSIQGKSKRKIVIALGVGGSSEAPAEFYVIPVDTVYRFKRIGKKYLPHYLLKDPRNNFKNHLNDWFYNDVFKNKKS